MIGLVKGHLQREIKKLRKVPFLSDYGKGQIVAYQSILQIINEWSEEVPD